MLRPKKLLVGVTVDTERDEAYCNVDETYGDPDIDATHKTNDVEENEVSLDIEEFIENNELQHSNTVDVDEKPKHMSTVVHEFFNESGFSADRLRRVQVYSKFLCEDNEDIQEELELNDLMIMIGDLVCAKIPLKNGSACFCIGKISSMRNIAGRKISEQCSTSLSHASGKNKPSKRSIIFFLKIDQKHF